MVVLGTTEYTEAKQLPILSRGSVFIIVSLAFEKNNLFVHQLLYKSFLLLHNTISR